MTINNFLLEEKVGRLMVRLSLPAISGMIIYSLFSLVDTFFVAQLGIQALAAVTLCIPIEILLISVGSATGVGITSLLSRTLGQENYSRADNIAWHGLTICVLYGFLFSWLGVTNVDHLLQLFGVSPELYALCRQYLSIILLGSLFVFIPMTCGNILQGEGNTSLPMYTSLAAIILNVILDPILIFGWGPVAPMGLAGAAWASVVAQAFCSVIALVTMYRSRVYLSWSVRNFRPDIQVLVGIYQVGLPTLLMEMVSVVILVFFNKVLMSFGSVAVAVMGIFSRIRSLFYTPVFGLTQGAMPIIGFAYGAGNHDRVKEAIIKATIVSLIFVTAGWLAMQLNSQWLMERFTSDPELIDAGMACMHVATLCLPVMGPIIILGSALQAMGYGVSAMVLSVIRQAIFFIPSILVLSHWWGLNGIWLAFSVSEFLSAILSLAFLVHLWQGLYPARRSPRLLLLRPGNLMHRMAAWLRW